jgi:hypothetical protein
MTHVIPLASPRAGFQVQPPAPVPTTTIQALDAITPRRRISDSVPAARA